MVLLSPISHKTYSYMTRISHASQQATCHEVWHSSTGPFKHLLMKASKLARHNFAMLFSLLIDSIWNCDCTGWNRNHWYYRYSDGTITHYRPLPLLSGESNVALPSHRILASIDTSIVHINSFQLQVHRVWRYHLRASWTSIDRQFEPSWSQPSATTYSY